MNTSSYIINRSPHTALDSKTPGKVWTGKMRCMKENEVQGEIQGEHRKTKRTKEKCGSFLNSSLCVSFTYKYCILSHYLHNTHSNLSEGRER